MISAHEGAHPLEAWESAGGADLDGSECLGLQCYSEANGHPRTWQHCSWSTSQGKNKKGVLGSQQLILIKSCEIIIYQPTNLVIAKY